MSCLIVLDNMSNTEIFPLPTRASMARKKSRLERRTHKGHEVYTGSGHRCGVIPYSSVWCGGLPQGLMMNNTGEERPRERCS